LFAGTTKIVLVIEYNGERYHGFQWQAKVPTIQGELEEAIAKLTQERRRVIAASRTDAGVHAKGQVVSFWTAYNLPCQTWVKALNYYLPNDIVVKQAFKGAEDFDIRRDAVSREYDYYIWNSSVKSVFAKGLAYFVSKPLNLPAMQEACQVLEGKHDFASFATFLGKILNTVRTVYEAKLRKKGELVIFHIAADSFLPHQVRNTIGLLIGLGLGKIGIADFRQIMETKTLGLAGPTAPAYGLYLTKVNYTRPFIETSI